MAAIRYDDEVKEQTISNFFKIALPVLFPIYFICHFYDRITTPEYAWFYLVLRLTLLPVIALFYFAFKKKWHGPWHLWFVWISAGMISSHMSFMALFTSHPEIYLLAILMTGSAFLMLFPLSGKYNLFTGFSIFLPYSLYLIFQPLALNARLSIGFQALGMGLIFLTASASFDRMRLRAFKQKTDLFVLATTDSLSGLKLRRYFFNRFIQELSLQFRKREDMFLSCVMIDIDSFKNINDRYGHPVGDRCIRHVGEIIQKNVRIYDVACRFGGEEFTILFPSTQFSETAMVCERIRKSIENSTVMIGNREVRLTVSIGISGIISPIPKELHGMHFKNSKEQQIFLVKSMMRIIKEADQALYEAKRQGKNRVITGNPADLLLDLNTDEMANLKQYLVYFEQQSLIFDGHDIEDEKREDDYLFYPPEFFFRRCVEGLYRRYRDSEWSETLALIRFKNIDFKSAKKNLEHLFRLSDVITILEPSLIGVIFVGMHAESLTDIRERIVAKLLKIPGMGKVEVYISASELRFSDEMWDKENNRLVRREDFSKEVDRIFSVLKRYRFERNQKLYFYQSPQPKHKLFI